MLLYILHISKLGKVNSVISERVNKSNNKVWDHDRIRTSSAIKILHQQYSSLHIPLRVALYRGDQDLICHVLVVHRTEKETK